MPEIMLPPGDCPGKNVYARFRSELPGGCRFRVWARDFYEFILDGESAGYGPVKSAAPLCYFDEYTLPEGGVHLVEFKVHRRDGDAEFWSDAPGRWMARRLHEYAVDAPRNIGETGFSEFYDFDAPEEEFAPVRCGMTFPGEWLRPRPLPYFREKRLVPVAMTDTRERLIADFGEMVYGRIELSGHGRSSRGDVTISYIEDFGRGWAHSSGREEMYHDSFRGGGENYRFRSFGKRGFRYVAISGERGVVDRVEVLAFAAELPELGRFQSSDARLNRLWEISRATVALCLDDIINDCPHRDQAQWMDAYVSSKCAFSLFGETKLAAKALLQHALCSFRDGRIYSPSICGNSDMPDYALVLWLFLRDYYHLTGDLETVRECYPNCRTSLENLRACQDTDHLLRNRSGAYLDNTFDLCRLGKSAALNALFYGALVAAAELSDRLDEPATAALFRGEAEQVRRSFRNCFIVDGMVRDSDSRPEETRWSCLNFSCEFGNRWCGGRARVKTVFRSVPGKLRIWSAAYGPYRAIFNGVTVVDERSEADWGRPFPAYAPQQTEVMTAAQNELCFEVECNPINWELYFSLPGCEPPEWEIEEIDPETGAVITPRRSVRPRPWFPPRLSQTTYGYAGYCGLLTKEELRQSLTDTYYRNYIGIRTPLFSTETADPELLSGWVMPPNTPWTMFFYLSALFSAGLGSEALALLRRAWGVMLDAGAVNTFEEWGCNASLCHAWGGAAVRFITGEILGVDDSELYRRHLRIRPELFDLDFATGAVAVSARETVEVELRRINQTTGFRIRIPAGFTAEIDLSRLENPVALP